MKSIIIILLLMLCLSFGVVEAQPEWRQICVNDTHIEQSMPESQLFGETLPASSFVKECEYGCDTRNNICSPAPIQQNVYIIIGIGAIIILFLIIRKVKD